MRKRAQKLLHFCCFSFSMIKLNLYWPNNPFWLGQRTFPHPQHPWPFNFWKTNSLHTITSRKASNFRRECVSLIRNSLKYFRWHYNKHDEWKRCCNATGFELTAIDKKFCECIFEIRKEIRHFNSQRWICWGISQSTINWWHRNDDGN